MKKLTMIEPNYSPNDEYSWNFKPDKEKRAFSIKNMKPIITIKEIPKLAKLITNQ